MKIDRTGGKMDDLNQSTGHDENNDLLQIKGIGKSTAQILNSVGIYTCADLSGYTLDELIELVKGKLPSITLQRIERDDWIGQARRLTESQSKEIQSPPETEPAPFPAETSGWTSPGKYDENWQELADFFVSFGNAINTSGKVQLTTRIYHSQADTSEEWEGIATEKLVDWMLAQANLPQVQALEEQTRSNLPESQETSEFSTEETSAPQVQMELSEMSVSEITPVSTAATQSRSVQLRSKSNLNLVGSGATLLAGERVPYFIELYLVNMKTNQSNRIGSLTGELEPGNFTYEIQLDFPVPPLGEYQLFLFARLIHPAVEPVHLQGPIIDVEP